MPGSDPFHTILTASGRIPIESGLSWSTLMVIIDGNSVILRPGSSDQMVG